MTDGLDRQLNDLVTHVLGMGERADGMLSAALQALVDPSAGTTDHIDDTDALIDRAYRDVQNGVLAALVLHRPVGQDLRTLTALIHVSLHLERMGDYASNVARTTTISPEHASEPELVGQLAEMGELARDVGRAGLRSFVDRDLELAGEVVRLDDGVDRLNLGIFHRLVRSASTDESRVEWAARMVQVTRQLERFADHGVDIAEMTAFVAGSELPSDTTGGAGEQG